MEREKYEAILESLQLADDSYIDLGQVDLVEIREKSVCISWDSGCTLRNQWFPKRLCGHFPSIEGRKWDNSFAVKRWFVAKEGLWHVVDRC